MGGLLVFALIIETWIALPHAVVGDQGIDLQLGELFEVAFRVVTRIVGDEAAAGDERGNNQCAFDRLDHRDEQFLLAAGAVGLGIDDDLVFGVDCCHAGEPWMTPLLVAILADSLSVRLLFLIVPLLPLRSSGWAASH